MITLRYFDGDKEFERLDEVKNFAQRELFKSFAKSVLGRLTPIECPNDKEAKATIIINIGNFQYDLKIAFFCCTDFEQLIQPEIENITRNRPQLGQST